MNTLLLLFLLDLIGLAWGNPEIPEWNPKCFAQQRDLNILYLRSMSGRKSDASVIKCDPGNQLYSEFSFLVVEAFRYEIERVNARTDLLPNVTLGFIVLDFCRQDLAALAAMFYTMPNTADKDTFPDDELITCETGMKRFSNVIGGVGPSHSTAGVMVGAVSSLFQFPLVMTRATSDELSDKTRFAYTMRLVPPDRFAAEAMIDLMIRFGWNYAALLYMEGSYGENGAKQIEKQAKEKGVCIAFSRMITSGSTEKEVDDVIEGLLEFTNIRVIISYMFIEVLSLFQTVLKARGMESHYMWLGSDSFSLDVKDVFYDGAIVVAFDVGQDPEFLQYFEGINPTNTRDNPWTPFFWEKARDCEWNESHAERSCQAQQNEAHGYQVSPTGGGTKPMDGVQVIARALHELITNKCPLAFGNRSKVRDCVNGHDLHAYMLNSSFDGFSGKIKFDKKGDFLGKYVFRQYQHVNRDTVAVAVWDKSDGSLEIFHDKLQWFSAKGNVSEKGLIPDAVCSQNCKTKEYYIQKDLPCCWECRECRNNEIIIENRTNCETCPALMWPDEMTATVCLDIEPDFLKWTSPLAIAMISAVGVGVVFCTFAAIIFIKKKEAKIIKASSRQLMVMILCGIILAYITAIVLLFYPSIISCYVGRFGFNLSVSFIFAPLLIKTNRVYRIFSAGKKGKNRPPLTGSKAQLVMVLSAILLEMLLCIISAILAPPEPVYRMQVPTKKHVEILCSLPLSGLLPPLCLNLLFILTCAVYGFLTRKLPENYNESWYIFVSVSTTTFLWLVFLPAYFTAFYVIHQLTLLVVCLIINATITLLCLYYPKIYCIYFTNENDLQIQTASTFGTSQVAPANTVSSNVGVMNETANNSSA